jgi:nitroreductase
MTLTDKVVESAPIHTNLYPGIAAEFYELVRRRHSIRSFEPNPPREQDIHFILDAANRAPSAGNVQAYQIYVVTRHDQLDLLAKAASEQEFLARAPIVLAFCADPAASEKHYGKRGAELFSIQDATLAAAYAQLACTAVGLANVWVGSFDESAAARAIGVPMGLRPVVLMPIGYTKEVPELSTRRPLFEMVHNALDGEMSEI